MGREPRGIEPVFITTAQAAACLGPSSLNPLRRCAQQSKSAARITRTGNGPGVPFEGGPPWGRCVFSRWLAVHHSPFTVYFHRPLARKGGSNYPHGNPLGRTYEGGVPCHRSSSGTRPTCRTVRPRGDNRHSSRPQGCNLCHPKRTGTRSGKNCFSFGIDIFCRGHRGHAVNKYPKLLSQLINSVHRTSRGQKLSTGDTGDKIALSTRVNPNKCRQLAQFKTMLSTGWPKLRFFCPRLFPAETPQKSPKVAIPATTYRTLCVLAFLRLRRLAVRSRPWSWPPTAPAVRAARWFGSWPAQWR